jgi:hypothetical protein
MCESNEFCEGCPTRCFIGDDDPVCVNCDDLLDQGCDFCEEAEEELSVCVDCGEEYYDYCPACGNDGQPSEYDEWQDYMGGDDWDHGQYDDY